MAEQPHRHWAVAGVSVLALSWASWISLEVTKDIPEKWAETDRVQEAVLARLNSTEAHDIEHGSRITNIETRISNIPYPVNDKDRWTATQHKAFAEHIVDYVDLKHDAQEHRISKLEKYFEHYHLWKPEK